MPEDPWEPYEREQAAGDDCVPVARWGQDHWSTLAYFETLEVDKHGLIENARMRCNSRLHRGFSNIGRSLFAEGAKYPTRLRGAETIEPHDDWSCLEDMVALGLARAWVRVRLRTALFGHLEAKVALTEEGRALAEALRRHKAAGGRFADFEPAVAVATP